VLEYGAPLQRGDILELRERITQLEQELAEKDAAMAELQEKLKE
jgi:uncharacterized coiled-coil protein SlyX